MKTKAAFNPFEHSRLFFLAGIAFSLGIVQLAFQWNGMSMNRTIIESPVIDLQDWMIVDVHSEKPEIIETIAREPEEKQEQVITPISQIIEVVNTKKLVNPIKLVNPEKDPVRLKQSGMITTTTGGTKTKAEVGTIAEVMPEFPGGFQAMNEWLAKNVNYPKYAYDAGIEGVVYVSFIIGTDGKVGNVELIRGIGGGCDEEVMRVIKSMPAWSPAKQGDVRVPLKSTIPFKFVIH